MKLLDRFICRREGHIPSMRFTSGQRTRLSWITTCQRCGKAVELGPDGTETRSA